jgi:hypothetical protein
MARMPRNPSGLFKAAAAPWTPSPEPPPSLARAPQILAAAAFDSLPPPSFRRREVARELRLKVSKTPMLFVVDPMHPVALATSPELPCRAAASSRRSAALPPLSPPLLASPPHALHVGVFRVPNRAPKP